MSLASCELRILPSHYRRNLADHLLGQSRLLTLTFCELRIGWHDPKLNQPMDHSSSRTEQPALTLSADPYQVSWTYQQWKSHVEVQ